MSDLRQDLYNKLTSKSLLDSTKTDFATFSKGLDDPTTRRGLYDRLLKTNLLKSTSFESFDQKIAPPVESGGSESFLSTIGRGVKSAFDYLTGELGLNKPSEPKREWGVPSYTTAEGEKVYEREEKTGAGVFELPPTEVTGDASKRQAAPAGKVGEEQRKLEQIQAQRVQGMQAPSITRESPEEATRKKQGIEAANLLDLTDTNWMQRLVGVDELKSGARQLAHGLISKPGPGQKEEPDIFIPIGNTVVPIKPDVLRGATRTALAGLQMGMTAAYPQFVGAGIAEKAFGPPAEELGQEIGGETGKKIAQKAVQYGSLLPFGAVVTLGSVASDLGSSGVRALLGKAEWAKDIPDEDKDLFSQAAGQGAFFATILGAHYAARPVEAARVRMRDQFAQHLEEEFKSPEELRNVFARVNRGEGTDADQSLVRMVNQQFESPGEAVRKGVSKVSTMYAPETPGWLKKILGQFPQETRLQVGREGTTKLLPKAEGETIRPGAETIKPAVEPQSGISQQPQAGAAIPEFKNDNEAEDWGRKNPQAVADLTKKAQDLESDFKARMKKKDYTGATAITYQVQKLHKALQFAQDPNAKTERQRYDEYVAQQQEELKLRRESEGGPPKDTREPWQIPREEWIARRRQEGATDMYAEGQQHENAVAAAAGRGEKVPQQVLARYPKIREHPQYKAAFAEQLTGGNLPPTKPVTIPAPAEKQGLQTAQRTPDQEAETERIQAELRIQRQTEQKPAAAPISQQPGPGVSPTGQKTETIKPGTALQTDAILQQSGVQPTRLNIEDVPLNQIHTDVDAFQNRQQEYSEESVNRIVGAAVQGKFNWQEFDPILLWENPENKQLFVLSGHSRTEAFRRVQSQNPEEFGSIPAKILRGVSKDQAIEVAKRSNVLSTRETPVERSNYYRKMRTQGRPASEIETEARNLEGRNSASVISLSHLNPDGKALSAVKSLGSESGESSRNALTMAEWTGSVKQSYPDLTPSHENEVYDFLTQNFRTVGRKITSKSQFQEFLDKAIGQRMENGLLKPDTPLNLNKLIPLSRSESEYDERIAQAEKDVHAAIKNVATKGAEFLQGGATGTRLDELLKSHNEQLILAQNELKRLRDNRDKELGRIRQAEQTLFTQIDNAKEVLVNAGLNGADVEQVASGNASDSELTRITGEAEQAEQAAVEGEPGQAKETGVEGSSGAVAEARDKYTGSLFPEEKTVGMEFGKKEPEGAGAIRGSQEAPVESTTPDRGEATRATQVKQGPLIPISPDDISKQLTDRAYAGISFSPDVRGKQLREDYVDHMNNVVEEFTALADTREKKEVLRNELERYKRGYVEHYSAWLRAMGNILSPMITGPSGFPARRNEKANNAENRRREELHEWQKRALSAIRAKLVGPSRITAELPDAVQQLQKKVDQANNLQERMKAANLIVKSKKIPDQEKIARLMKEVGISQPAAAELLKPDFAGRVGFADYALKNNGAEIRRLEARMVEVAQKQGQVSSVTPFEGGRIEDNVQADRVQVFFDAKPDEAMRTKLKAEGFHWSPTVGAWQRQRGESGYRAVKNVLGVDVKAQEKPAGIAEPNTQYPKSYKNLKGETLEFTGEFAEDVLPRSQNVAIRNRRTVYYPKYRNTTTGQTEVRADFPLKEKPGTVAEKGEKYTGHLFPTPETIRLEFDSPSTKTYINPASGEPIRYENENKENPLSHPRREGVQRPSVRPLQTGEEQYARRFYTASKQFQFFADKERITSLDQVAFLFRQLETESVEHSFFVHVDETGRPVVQHLTSGTFNSALVPMNVVADFIDRYKTKELYFVHNHPSGNLSPSAEDVNIHSKIKRAVGSTVKVHDGIIVDSNRGRYSVFGQRQQAEHEGLVAEPQIPVKAVYFNKIQYLKPIGSLSRAMNETDVAEFISRSQFSVGPKLQLLSLTAHNRITGRFTLSRPFEEGNTDVEGLGHEINVLVTRSGGVSAIVLGNKVISTNPWVRQAIKDLHTELNQREVSMLDYIGIEPSRSAQESARAEAVFEPKSSFERRETIGEQTPQYIPELKQKIQSAFKLDEEKAEAVMSYLDGHAEVWAKQTGRDKNEWYPTHIADVVQGGVVPDEALAQYVGKNAMLPSVVMRAGRTAIEMKEWGYDPEKIRLATGWFVNPYDNMWRYEISDDRADLTMTPRQLNDLAADGEKAEARLADVLSHPVLYKLYPGFAEIRVHPYYDEASSTGASFKQGAARIDLNLAAYEWSAGTAQKEALMHELQHAIQFVEGFSPGSNVDRFMPKELVRKMIDMREKTMLLHSIDPQQSSTEAERKQRIEKQLTEFEKEWASARKEALEKYRLSSGEIEARDTESRMTLDAIQRRDLKPFSTEGIAPDQAYVLDPNAGLLIRRFGVSQEPGVVRQDYLQEFLADLRKKNPEEYARQISTARSNQRKEAAKAMIPQVQDQLQPLIDRRDQLNREAVYAKEKNTADYRFPYREMNDLQVDIRRLTNRLDMLNKVLTAGTTPAQQESMFSQEQGKPGEETGRRVGPSREQIVRLYTIASSRGYTNADVKKLLVDEYNLTSTKDLTREQYDELVNIIQTKDSPEKPAGPQGTLFQEDPDALGRQLIESLQTTAEGGSAEDVMKARQLAEESKDLFTPTQRTEIAGFLSTLEKNLKDLEAKKQLAAGFERIPEDEIRKFREIIAQKRIEKQNRGPLTQGRKAAVEFLSDHRAVIHAFENADLSSVIHETMHIFRRDLPEDDMKAVEEWAGVKNGEWTREAEEKFARAGERYIREGAAPTSKLRAVFQKLKEWLTGIYKAIKGTAIDIRIPENIRQVFDRLFAVESEAESKYTEQKITSPAAVYAMEEGGVDAKRVMDNLDVLYQTSNAPDDEQRNRFIEYVKKIGWTKDQADYLLKRPGPYGRTFLRNAVDHYGDKPKEIVPPYIDTQQPIDEVGKMSNLADKLRTSEERVLGEIGEKAASVIEAFKAQGSPSTIARNVFNGSANNPVVDAAEAVQTHQGQLKEHKAYVAKLLKDYHSAKRTIRKELLPLARQYGDLHDQLMDLCEVNDGKLIVRKGEEDKALALYEKMEPILNTRESVIDELAHRFADVRIWMYADGSATPQILAKMSPQEKVAGDRIQELMKMFEGAFEKVGIPTIRSRRYITHLLIEHEQPKDINMSGFDILPEQLAFKHRTGNQTWMPSIIEAMKYYLPAANRKLAFTPYLQKWTPYFNSVQDNPIVKHYFEWYIRDLIGQSRPGLVEKVHDMLNVPLQFEVVRLIGGSLSAGFKHMFKLPQEFSGSPLPVTLNAALRTIQSTINYIPSHIGLTPKSFGEKLSREFITNRALTAAVDEMPTQTVNRAYRLAGRLLNFVSPVELIENLEGVTSKVIMASQAGLDPITTKQYVWDWLLRAHFRGGKTDAPPLWRASGWGLFGRTMGTFMQTPFKIMGFQKEAIKDAFRGGMDVAGDPRLAKALRYWMSVAIIISVGAKFGWDFFRNYFHGPFIDMFHPAAEMTEHGVHFQEPRLSTPPLLDLANEMHNRGIISGALAHYAGIGKNINESSPFGGGLLEKGVRLGTGKIPKIYQGSTMRYLLASPTLEAQDAQRARDKELEERKKQVYSRFRPRLAR